MDAPNIPLVARAEPILAAGDENPQSTKANEKNDTVTKANVTTTSSKKRKSDAVDESENLQEVDDNDPRLNVLNETCNQVRKKIRTFIEGGNMKVGEFQKAIGVSPRAYQHFMNQNRPYKGSECDTYPKAFVFFKKRELQGLKAAPPKKVKKDAEKKTFDVSGVKLDGEKPRKCRSFCCAIAESFPEERKIQSRQLNAFLGKKGPTSGNTSSVFYWSYVFFEKLHIKEGKPKSQMRQEMEKIHPTGLNTNDFEQYWTCLSDERPVQDKYGQMHFLRP